MAAMNSSVLACNYAVSGCDLNTKVRRISPSVATVKKLPMIRAKMVSATDSKESGRRGALLGLGAALFTAAVSASSANAGVIEESQEKGKATKEKIGQGADAVKGKAEGAKDNTGNFFTTAKDKASEAAQATKDKVAGVGQATKDKVSGTGQATKDKTAETAQATKDKFSGGR